MVKSKLPSRSGSVAMRQLLHLLAKMQNEGGGKIEYRTIFPKKLFLQNTTQDWFMNLKIINRWDTEVVP